MGRHYLLKREKKSGREQSKLDILTLIVREEGEKPIKTKKRVTLIIKRMTSKKLLNLLRSSLFFRAAHEEPRPAAQILALQAGLQGEEDRGGPGQRRGQNVYLDRKFPIQEQRRYSKPSVLK
jgi:hypothetical protein